MSEWGIKRARVAAEAFMEAFRNYDISSLCPEDLEPYILDCLPTWQPIETAPQHSVDLWCVMAIRPSDGPEAVSFCRRGFRVANAEWIKGEWWSENYTLRFRGWIPIHWMPLPEPPPMIEPESTKDRSAG